MPRPSAETFPETVIVRPIDGTAPPQLTWQCSESDWAAVAAACPRATFFHTPAWAAAVAAAGHGQPHALLAAWPDGRRAVLGVAVRDLWRGLVRQACQGSHGGYGGILANAPLSRAETESLYAHLLRRFPDCQGLTNPFALEPPQTGMTLQPTAGTRILTLAPLDVLRSRYSTERRRAVRRYQAESITVRTLTRPGPAELDVFWRLYQLETVAWRQQGRPLHWLQDRRWFEQLWRVAGERLRLAVATVDGEAAGALLWVGFGQVATYLYMAWDHRHESLRLGTALLESGLHEAYAAGFTAWDMLGSGTLAGVDRFKASFGAEVRPVWQFARQSRRTRLLTQARRWWHDRLAPPAAGPIRQS